MNSLINLSIVHAFSKTIRQARNLHEAREFAQSLSQNQFLSKQWLVDHLNMQPKKILVLGGWYCNVFPLLLQSNYTNVEIDCQAKYLSDYFAEQVGFSVETIYKDAKDFLTVSDLSAYDLVINTSCEHMPFDMKDVICDDRPMYAFQSNDYFEVDDHINCKNSLKEFVDSTGLSTIQYKGEYKTEKYTRYMVIGRL